MAKIRKTSTNAAGSPQSGGSQAGSNTPQQSSGPIGMPNIPAADCPLVNMCPVFTNIMKQRLKALGSPNKPGQQARAARNVLVDKSKPCPVLFACPFSSACEVAKFSPLAVGCSNSAICGKSKSCSFAKVNIGKGNPGFAKNVFDKVAKLLSNASDFLMISLACFLCAPSAQYDPSDSVAYLCTDVLNYMTGDELIADLIFGVRHYLYHIEFQRKAISSLCHRTFEQSLLFALNNANSVKTQHYAKYVKPKSVIIDVGDFSKGQSSLQAVVQELDDCHAFEIIVCKPLSYDLGDFLQPGLIALVPFHILKHENEVKRLKAAGELSDPSKIEELHEKLFNDIMEVIQEAANLKLIKEFEDSEILSKMLVELYKHCYALKYPELVLEEKTMDAALWGPTMTKKTEEFTNEVKKVEDRQAKIEAKLENGQAELKAELKAEFQAAISALESKMNDGFAQILKLLQKDAPVENK